MGVEIVNKWYGGLLLKMDQLHERLAWAETKELTEEQIKLLDELEKTVDELEALYDTE